MCLAFIVRFQVFKEFHVIFGKLAKPSSIVMKNTFTLNVLLQVRTFEKKN